MAKIDTILLVDDDNITNFINARLIRKLNIANQVQVSLNGQEALSYLSGIEKRCPDLIFLDINMPVMNGNELLTKIKTTFELCDIPCFMLSTSHNPRHINSALAAGAEKYIVKPAIYSDFKNLLEKTFHEIAM